MDSTIINQVHIISHLHTEINKDLPNENRG